MRTSFQYAYAVIWLTNKCFGASTRIVGNSVMLVIEYMTKGSLAENLKAMKDTMTLKRAIKWAKYIALSFLSNTLGKYAVQ